LSSVEATQLSQQWHISIQPIPIIISNTNITQAYYEFQQSCKNDLINNIHSMKFKRRQILALSHILDLDFGRSALRLQEIPIFAKLEATTTPYITILMFHFLKHSKMTLTGVTQIYRF
jgi:hypothetical protein